MPQSILFLRNSFFLLPFLSLHIILLKPSSTTYLKIVATNLATGWQNLGNVRALESQDGRCCWRVRQKTQGCSFCSSKIYFFCLQFYHPLGAVPILLLLPSSCSSVPALTMVGIIRPLPGTSPHVWGSRHQFCLWCRWVLDWFLLPSHKLQVLPQKVWFISVLSASSSADYTAPCLHHPYTPIILVEIGDHAVNICIPLGLII